MRYQTNFAMSGLQPNQALSDFDARLMADSICLSYGFFLR